MDKNNLIKSDWTKSYRQRLCNVFVFLSIVTFSNFSFCQSISTVSEIYNYNVDDIFHLEEYGSAPGQNFVKFSNIQIINKYYSSDNDSLFYVCDIKTAESSNGNPTWVYDEYTDVVSYTNLDSLINGGHIDTVFYDTLYNGRKINRTDSVPLILANTSDFIDGCGGPFYYYSNYPVTHYLKLRYFLKGTEEWGEPYYVSINEISLSNQYFKLYPNPAQDKIIVNNCYDILADSNINGLISSIDGHTIKKFSFSSDKSYTVDLSGICKGIYFVRLETDKQLYNYKFVKE